MSSARTIDLWLGVVLLVLGVLGLFFSQGGLLLGFIPTNLGLQVIYLIAGAALVYAGYTSTNMANTTSGVIGLAFAVLTVMGFFASSFLGLPVVGGWNIVVSLLVAVVLIFDWLGTPGTRKMT